MPFELADWIWANDADVVNQYIWARAEFEASCVGECDLLISADSQYVAYVNGQLAGFGQYADYPEHKVYDTICISNLVHPGTNELRVLAYCQGIDSSVYRAGRPKLLFEVRQDGRQLAHSGADTLVSRRTGYRSGDMERVSSQMGFTFDYDARIAEPEWEPAQVLGAAGTLYLRPIAPLELGERVQARVVSQGVYYDSPRREKLGMRMQYAALSFRESVELTGVHGQPELPGTVRYASDEGDGIYIVLDLGRETVGFLDIALTVPRECEVLVGWGEHVDDLRVRTYVGGRNFAARYMARAGRNEFMYAVRRAGLRYVELFVSACEFTLEYAGARPVVYRLNWKPEFRAQDALHMRIYDVCRDTLAACLHEHYEDCPWREQALYAMDSRNQMLCGYYAFGEYAAPRASLELFALSQREDGMLELCAPARCEITIPVFSLTYVLALEEYLMYSGDAAFVRDMLPVARRIVDAVFARRDGTGLIPAYTDARYWNFYEWRPGMAGVLGQGESVERYDAPLNFMAMVAARRLSSMLQQLDEPGAQEYARAAWDVGARADEAFWDEARGVYATYLSGGQRTHECELTNALAVYSGACRAERVPRVLELLAGEKLAPVSLSYSIYVFEALLSAGDKYAPLVFERIARIWGDMLMRGATTFWETEEGGWDFDRGGSMCHGWSAVPLYLYMAYALGVKPVRPGFMEYDVRPLKCGIGVQRGTIHRKNGSVLKVDISEGHPKLSVD